MSSSRTFQTADLAKGAIFIALMAIGANLTSFITIGTVPLTFQTVVAILAGILLGKRLGAFSMIGYFFIGLTGLPVFSGFTGGFHVIASPTFGFIISFIVLAYAVGSVIEYSSAEPSLAVFFTASFIGLLINYGIGIPYLYFHSQFILGLENVQFLLIAAGMTPFFIKDFILAIFTAVLAPQLMKAVYRKPSMKQDSQQKTG